jgi:hypothetical protein
LSDCCHCILLKKLDFKSKPYISVRMRPLVRLAQAQPNIPAFLLTEHEDLLSLRAQDASLKDIIEEIGRQLHFETVVKLSPEVRLTMAFDDLSLAQVVKELRKCAIIAFVERGVREERRITKLLAFTGRTGEAPPAGAAQAPDTAQAAGVASPERRLHDVAATKRLPHPQAFQFKFDPLQILREEK